MPHYQLPAAVLGICMDFLTKLLHHNWSNKNCFKENLDPEIWKILLLHAFMAISTCLKGHNLLKGIIYFNSCFHSWYFSLKLILRFHLTLASCSYLMQCSATAVLQGAAVSAVLLATKMAIRNYQCIIMCTTRITSSGMHLSNFITTSSVS